MGYEVLDVGGEDPRAADRLRGPGGAVEVHDLDSLPTPRDERGGRADGRGPSRRSVALVAVTLIAATVGGGAYWSGHRAADSTSGLAAGRPRVLAVGQPATLAVAGPATAASLRISIVNVGQVPVQVVTSPAQVRPVQGATLVGLADGGSGQIAPGDAQRVVAVVGISCVSSTSVTPSLSIRGPDGKEVPVVVRDANLDTYRVNAQAICGAPAAAALTAQLSGSVRSPWLVVRNASDHDIAVVVDPHSPVPQAPDPSKAAADPSLQGGVIVPPVELTTVPRLPVLLPAWAVITVTVGVHLRGCLPLAALSLQGYLQLVGVPVAGQAGGHDVPETSTTVDLTALLGSQLADACR